MRDQGVWSCKGTESGTVFNEVELSLDEEDGWIDYDEKVRRPVPRRCIWTDEIWQSALPVSVTELASKIERA